MTVYEMPAYMKPRIKIVSWILTMVFHKDLKQEFVAELPDVNLVIKDWVKAYTKYHLLTMRTDLLGYPKAFKIFIEPSSKVIMPLDEVIKEITGGKEFGKIRGEFNLLNSSGKKLIEAIYNLLDKDFRKVLNIPTRWLIYISDKKMLTRICWVIALSGEITVRPFGVNSILLEARNVKFDAINESIRIIKQNNLIKDKLLNQEWRYMIVAEEMTELAKDASAKR